MRFELMLVPFMLCGCVTPAPDAAYDECGARRAEKWTLVERPESDVFRSAELQLNASATEREVWFRNRDGRLLACVFTPDKDVCVDGHARTLEFTPKGSSWESGHVSDVECVVVTSDATQNKPPLPTRNREAPLLAAEQRR